ncbi:hypothetical protein CHI14_13505 [Paenibacillus sp. 7516]|nr:hypothetical protein CHI14_13505 [Paenibacillus sp. 7516]
MLVFVALGYLTGLAGDILKRDMGLFYTVRKTLTFNIVASRHLVDGILSDGHVFRIKWSFISEMSPVHH